MTREQASERIRQLIKLEMNDYDYDVSVAATMVYLHLFEAIIPDLAKLHERLDKLEDQKKRGKR